MTKMTKTEKKWKNKYVRCRDSERSQNLETARKRVLELDAIVEQKDGIIEGLRVQIRTLEAKIDG